MMSPEKDLIDQLTQFTGQNPEIEKYIEYFLKVDKEQLTAIGYYLNSLEITDTITANKTINEIFKTWDLNHRILPMKAIDFVTSWAQFLKVEPKVILSTLVKIFGIKDYDERFVRFFGTIKPGLEKIQELDRILFYHKRNTRFLQEVVTNTDLRAIYKSDFLIYDEVESYDPILDLTKLSPLAGIRIIFDKDRNEHFDFTCDLNGINLLIKSLQFTKKQLLGLKAISDIIGENKDG